MITDELSVVRGELISNEQFISLFTKLCQEYLTSERHCDQAILGMHVLQLKTMVNNVIKNIKHDFNHLDVNNLGLEKRLQHINALEYKQIDY